MESFDTYEFSVKVNQKFIELIGCDMASKRVYITSHKHLVKNDKYHFIVSKKFNIAITILTTAMYQLACNIVHSYVVKVIKDPIQLWNVLLEYCAEYESKPNFFVFNDIKMYKHMCYLKKIRNNMTHGKLETNFYTCDTFLNSMEYVIKSVLTVQQNTVMRNDVTEIVNDFVESYLTMLKCIHPLVFEHIQTVQQTEINTPDSDEDAMDVISTHSCDKGKIIHIAPPGNDLGKYKIVLTSTIADMKTRKLILRNSQEPSQALRILTGKWKNKVVTVCKFNGTNTAVILADGIKVLIPNTKVAQLLIKM